MHHKVALITGCAKGIGKHLATQFYKRNFFPHIGLPSVAYCAEQLHYTRYVVHFNPHLSSSHHKSLLIFPVIPNFAPYLVQNKKN